MNRTWILVHICRCWSGDGICKLWSAVIISPWRVNLPLHQMHEKCIKFSLIPTYSIFACKSCVVKEKNGRRRHDFGRLKKWRKMWRNVRLKFDLRSAADKECDTSDVQRRTVNGQMKPKSCTSSVANHSECNTRVRPCQTCSSIESVAAQWWA